MAGPGKGHNGGPSLDEEGWLERIVRPALGKIGGALSAVLSLGGDTCRTCLTTDLILSNPESLRGLTLTQVREAIVNTGGWKEGPGVKGTHASQVWAFRQTGTKDYTGRLIRWHPGGGHHGPNPYWIVNNGHGNIRVPSGGR
jgi:hypothetical protein